MYLCSKTLFSPGVRGHQSHFGHIFKGADYRVEGLGCELAECLQGHSCILTISRMSQSNSSSMSISSSSSSSSRSSSSSSTTTTSSSSSSTSSSTSSSSSSSSSHNFITLVN